MQLTARNVSVHELFDLLAGQHAAKVDVVLPATALIARNGMIEVATGAEPLLSEAGLTSIDGLYRPTDVFIEHVAERLDIPVRYLRKMATVRPDLFDSNINGWLHGTVAHIDAFGGTDVEKADRRKFLFRGLVGNDENVARGLLSNLYKIVDNLDVVRAVVEGINSAATDNPDAAGIQVAGADLSDRRMYLRFVAPNVEFGARELLKDYRSPFDRGVERAGGGGWSVERARQAAAREGQGYVPGTEPIGWAGFEVVNSELGFSRSKITPRAEFEICGNGLKITEDLLGTPHLGARMDEGIIDWSDETRRKSLELVTAMTADAVRAFLSRDYWTTKVAELAVKAGKPVQDADKTVRVVAKSLGFGEAERAEILRHFILGGQLTAGGVMNAITSAAQTVANPDTAADMEGKAVQALSLV